jgi:putative DNA primase/helicase
MVDKIDFDEFRKRQKRGRDGTAPKILETTSMDKIGAEPISWIWKYWIARGKFEILAGRPGDGKSTVSLEFAATISTGGKFPDGQSAKAANVVIWSGEDNPADTIKPRLMRMDADMSRIHVVRSITQGNIKRPFDPSTDMAELCAAVARIGNVALVIIDPIVATMSRKTDSNKNAETRGDLQPLVDLAEQHNCAVLGLHHFTKGTVGQDPRDRNTGSLAFTALPRIVMATAQRLQKEDNEDEEGPSRIITRAKSNIGPEGGGFGYEIDVRPLHEQPDIAASRIVWREPLKGYATDLMNNVEKGSDGRSVVSNKVQEWLRQFLSGGPKMQHEVLECGAQFGHTDKQLRGAKEKIGVISVKSRGCGGGWQWHMPGGR